MKGKHIISITRNILAIFVLVFTLAACLGGLEQAKSKTEVNISERIDEDKNENGKEKDMTTEDYFYNLSNMGYECEREIIDAKEVLDIKKLNIPKMINEKVMSVYGFYDKNKILVYLFDDGQSVSDIEFGFYELESNEYSRIVDIEPDMNCRVAAVGLEYLIYEIYNSDYSESSLYYYDLEKNESKVFFAREVSEDEFNQTFNINENDILLMNNIIYFDDYELDDQGLVYLILYSYSIETGTIEMISKDMQNPLSYKDGIYAFHKGEDGIYNQFSSIDKKSMMVIDQGLMDITSSGDNLYSIVARTNEEKQYTQYFVKDMTNDEVLISTFNAIDRLDCNDDFVSWTNYIDDYAYLYDRKNDCFLELKDIGEGLFYFFLQKDYGIALHRTEDHWDYYYFSHKND